MTQNTLGKGTTLENWSRFSGKKVVHSQEKKNYSYSKTKKKTQNVTLNIFGKIMSNNNNNNNIIDSLSNNKHNKR